MQIIDCRTDPFTRWFYTPKSRENGAGANHRHSAKFNRHHQIVADGDDGNVLTGIVDTEGQPIMIQRRPCSTS